MRFAKPQANSAEKSD